MRSPAEIMAELSMLAERRQDLVGELGAALDEDGGVFETFPSGVRDDYVVARYAEADIAWENGGGIDVAEGVRDVKVSGVGVEYVGRDGLRRLDGRTYLAWIVPTAEEPF